MYLSTISTEELCGYYVYNGQQKRKLSFVISRLNTSSLSPHLLRYINVGVKAQYSIQQMKCEVLHLATIKLHMAY